MEERNFIIDSINSSSGGEITCLLCGGSDDDDSFRVAPALAVTSTISRSKVVSMDRYLQAHATVTCDVCGFSFSINLNTIKFMEKFKWKINNKKNIHK